jgi:predicted O-methyltransferase YrrM
MLDVACVAATIGAGAALLLLPNPNNASSGSYSMLPPATLAIIACILSALFLWSEGRRQVQLQRPTGIVFGEWLILLGVYELLATLTSKQLPAFFDTSLAATISLGVVLPIAAGGIFLAVITPRFVKGQEAHRILDRVAAQGEFVQPEYVAATAECPFPERWQMVDAQSAELEVLEFLKALVITAKPELVLETGTFIGHSAIKMAEGLRSNGFGRIITVEYDSAVFAKAKQNIEASGLGDWIEYRNGSSLDTKVDGQIDILFSDSDVNVREQEVRHFLPQIRPRGLVLIHDASSHFKVVREAALRLEKEGLLSVVLLSTPRGLVVAQKRELRS